MNELLEKYRTQAESKGIEKGIAIGKAEGKAEGLELGLDNTLKAISLLKAGNAIEDIASLLGFSVEKVKALQAEL